MKNKKLLALALLTAFGVSNNINAKISVRGIKQAVSPEATFKSDLKKYRKALEAGDEKYIETRFEKLESSFNALGKKAQTEFKAEFDNIKYDRLLSKAENNLSDVLERRLTKLLDDYKNGKIDAKELANGKADVLSSSKALQRWNRESEELVKRFADDPLIKEAANKARAEEFAKRLSGQLDDLEKTQKEFEEINKLSRLSRSKDIVDELADNLISKDVDTSEARDAIIDFFSEHGYEGNKGLIEIPEFIRKIKNDLESKGKMSSELRESLDNLYQNIKLDIANEYYKAVEQFAENGEYSKATNALEEFNELSEYFNEEELEKINPQFENQIKFAEAVKAAEELKKAYEELKERVDNGTATEKDGTDFQNTFTEKSKEIDEALEGLPEEFHNKFNEKYPEEVESEEKEEDKEADRLSQAGTPRPGEEPGKIGVEVDGGNDNRPHEVDV